MRLLRGHQRVAPRAHDLRRDGIGQIKRGRVFLGGVGEDADAVKAHLADEVQQVLELRVRLAGEADQERRPQGQIGQGVAHLAEQPLVLLDRPAALHRFEHQVVAVLQGHVNVGNDLRQFAQGVNQRLTHHRRVAVQQAQPLDAVHFGQRPQQFGQGQPPVQVHAVGGRVLRDQVQLPRARRGELPRFLDQPLNRLGAVLAANAGDGAERAGVVAAFGDLEIGRPRRRRRAQTRLGNERVLVGDLLRRD